MKKIQNILEKISKKSVLAVLLTGALALTAAACGSNQTNSTTGSSTTASTTAGSTSAEKVTLTVGATIVPHSEILEQVAPILAEQNIELKIVEYTDYVQPNQALLSGDLDANYFQHQPYLDSFNEDNNSDLLGVVAVHFEPLSIYKGRLDSLDALTEGAQIGVPNDTTNEARALLLLQQEGLIKLKDGVGLEATPNDIVENELNLEIVELAAESITKVLPSLDLAVINGNYALTDGLTAEDILASEATDSDAAEKYGNVIAVRNGDENRPEIKALIEAITSDEIADFIEEEYQGSVIPLG